MSSRARLTFRRWTWSCILCMGSIRGKEWIVTEGVGGKEGGMERGKLIHCWMLSRSKPGGVLSVFTLIHSNAGMRMIAKTYTLSHCDAQSRHPSIPTTLSHYAYVFHYIYELIKPVKSIFWYVTTVELLSSFRPSLCTLINIHMVA